MDNVLETDEAIVVRLISFMRRHPRQPAYWGSYAKRIHASRDELSAALVAYGKLAAVDDSL